MKNEIVQRVLFVCSERQLRSPTAEKIFSEFRGLKVASAGTSPDAEPMINDDLVIGSDLIFVMEKLHEEELYEKFSQHLSGKKVVCLDIPDRYDYMDPELIRILNEKVHRHLDIVTIW